MRYQSGNQKILWNHNEDRSYQNLEGPIKAVPRGKYVAVNPTRKRISPINYWHFHDKARKKEEQTKPKAGKMKEM